MKRTNQSVIGLENLLCSSQLASVKKTKVNRRNFCACMLYAGVGMAGTSLLSCSGNDSTGTAFSGRRDLSAAEVTTLQANGYIQFSDLIVTYTAGTTNPYMAFSRVCPHEQGEVNVESVTTARCQKHTSQTFALNNSARGNGAETSSSLPAYMVADNRDGTITVTG